MGERFGASRVNNRHRVSAMQMVEQLLALRLLLESRVSSLEDLVTEAQARPIPGVNAVSP